MKIVTLATTLFLLLAIGHAAPEAGTATPVASPTVASQPTTPDPFWPADGVFPGKGHVSSWPGFKSHNRERRTLFAQTQEQEHHAIVFVGDSITDGWNSLKQDFANLHVDVVNRGIGGDTTPNLLYRLQEDVLALQPRALVILIGTNDLGEHVSPADIADNFHILLTRIRADYPTIPIAWCLVMPRKGDDTYPARIHELNTQIKQLVSSDSAITVIDTFTPLALPDGTSIAEDFKPDHLHPNAAGYEVWRQALTPTLVSWKLGTPVVSH